MVPMNNYEETTNTTNTEAVTNTANTADTSTASNTADTNGPHDTPPRRHQTLHEASKAIKQEARRSLQGNHGLTVGAVVVYCLLQFALIFIAYGAMQASYNMFGTGLLQNIPEQIVSFLCDLLLGVWAYGLSSIFLCLQYRQPTGFGDLFRGFHENSGRILMVRTVYLLMTMVLQIPFQICEAVFDIGINSALPQHATYEIALYLAALLLYSIGSLWLYFTYALNWYVMLDYPELSWREVMRMSRQLMKGNRHVMLYVHLSFLPLDLASILTCGIASFWVRSYLEATDAAFYRGIILNRQNKTNR